MLKTFAAYAIAGAVGCGTPALVLWMARSAAPGSNPAWGVAAVAAGLAILAALMALLMPARWLSMAVIVSAPMVLVALAMFVALAEAGAYYWIWVLLALGSAAGALGGAWLAAGRRRA